MQSSVLFFSRPRSEGWPRHGRRLLSPISVLSSVIMTTGSPVHVLMLSTQAVRGLPRPRAPGIVPCIISFSLVSSWRDHSVLASLLWRCLTVAATTALLWTQSFVFLLSMKPAESLSVLSSQRHLSESPAFTAVFTAKYFFIICLLLSATWVTDWQLFNCIHSAVVSRETTADTKSYCCISQSFIDTFGHLRNWNLPFFIFNCFGHSLISRQTTWSCVRLTAVNFDLRFTRNLVGIKVKTNLNHSWYRV